MPELKSLGWVNVFEYTAQYAPVYSAPAINAATAQLAISFRAFTISPPVRKQVFLDYLCHPLYELPAEIIT